jgi:MOSC domain-containing protein YiiM
VSQEETAAIANDLGLDEILPDWMGANLLLEGIPALSAITPNTRLFFESGAVLLITEENNPCKTLSAEIASHFPGKPELLEKIVKVSMRRRGLVAVVELPGKITKGEPVRVLFAH